MLAYERSELFQTFLWEFPTFCGIFRNIYLHIVLLLPAHKQAIRQDRWLWWNFLNVFQNAEVFVSRCGGCCSQFHHFSSRPIWAEISELSNHDDLILKRKFIERNEKIQSSENFRMILPRTSPWQVEKVCKITKTEKIIPFMFSLFNSNWYWA